MDKLLSFSRGGFLTVCLIVFVFFLFDSLDGIPMLYVVQALITGEYKKYALKKASS